MRCAGKYFKKRLMRCFFKGRVEAFEIEILFLFPEFYFILMNRQISIEMFFARVCSSLKTVEEMIRYYLEYTLRRNYLVQKY